MKKKKKKPVKKKALIKDIWECFLIVNLILMNILKSYLIKLVNLLVLLASSEMFYRDHLFYKSNKPFVQPYGDIIYDKDFKRLSTET